MPTDHSDSVATGEGGLRLGLTVPLIALLFAIADGVTRWLPVELFAFRPWEAVLRPAGSTGTGPFVENAGLAYYYAYGDLAGYGNYRTPREYRVERFSTDERGFRRGIDRRPSLGMVNGDSFAVGAGVNDDQTFSSQLSARSGRGFANLGGDKPSRIEDIVDAAVRMRIEHGWVIHLYLERMDLPSRSELEGRRYSDAGSTEEARRSNGTFEWPSARLPFLLRRLGDQVFVTGPENPAAVPRLNLSNGMPMLFLGLDLERSRQGGPADASGLAWLRDQLTERGLRLLVVLVPNKYTVYGPLLVPDGVGGPFGLQMAAARRALEARQVPFVDLTGPLQEQARTALDSGELLYFIDDTHWNAKGIEAGVTYLLSRWQPYD